MKKNENLYNLTRVSLSKFFKRRFKVDSETEIVNNLELILTLNEINSNRKNVMIIF